jgi:hypothetical protein
MSNEIKKQEVIEWFRVFNFKRKKATIRSLLSLDVDTMRITT